MLIKFFKIPIFGWLVHHIGLSVPANFQTPRTVGTRDMRLQSMREY